MKPQVLSCIIYILSYCIKSGGEASDDDMLAVCPGEQLTLTCQTTQDEFLFWNIYVPYHNKSYSRLHASEGVREVTHEVVDFMVTLTFARISESGVPPLVSQLSINNAATTLNGTTINCTEYSLSNIILQRSIHIIDATHAKTANSLGINQTEHFSPNYVTIFLEWVEETGLRYNINAMFCPEVDIRSFGRNGIQLTLSYNIVHTLNVTASLCGSSTAWTLLNFSYAKCDYPMLQTTSFTTIMGYSNPAIQGTNVTFMCPPGLVLTGPNTSTCMLNGEWDVDLRSVRCTGEQEFCAPPSPPPNGYISPYNNTIVGTMITFSCEKNCQCAAGLDLEQNLTVAVCNQEGKWEPDPIQVCSKTTMKQNRNEIVVSTVVASTLLTLISSSIIIMFLIGCACGYYLSLRWMKQPENHEDIQQPATNRQNLDQTLEMTENVAYGPL